MIKQSQDSKQIGDVLRGEIVHAKQNAFTESSRLMVPDSSKWMTSSWLDQTFSRQSKNIRTLRPYNFLILNI